MSDCCAPVQTTAVRQVQWLTLAWMSVEMGVALTAAVRAQSVALAGFGGDSAIEILSAGVVLWRFHSQAPRAEAIASRLTAWLLLALAAFIAAGSFHILRTPSASPRPSYLGMALLVAATVVMPWLARRKRQLAAASGSVALAADAGQSSLCAYMAWIALGGIFVNAVLHISWADPVAALCLLPIVLREAQQAWRGRRCCD